jgi:hypothetical protein
MANILAEQLADGVLGVAEADVYLCPAGTRAFIKSMSFANKLGAATGMEIFLRPNGGTSRRIAYMSVMDDGDTFYYDAATPLDAGDAIRGVADDAAAVDYIVSGAEQVTT